MIASRENVLVGTGLSNVRHAFSLALSEMTYAAKAALRDNRVCTSYLQELKANETKRPEELAYQARRALLRTLQVACRSLPHYRRVRLDCAEHEVEDALRALFPVVDKEALLSKPWLFYPSRVRYPWATVAETSGTSGAPLRILRDLRSIVVENAFLKRHWSWSGFKDGMRRATLRGDNVRPASNAGPPYWYYNRYNNQLLFSSVHLVPRTADAFIERLTAWAPYLLQAYPSYAADLATYLKERGKRLAIPYVYTGSEPIDPCRRELIETYLGKVMDFYGMAERVAFASECEFGNLHVNTDYSYVEILDDDGRPTKDLGYVVGTTFHNFVMPLVRYRLSDMTRWKPGACTCGRPYPMIERIAGRVEEAIEGSRGNNISPVLYRITTNVSHVRQTQVALVAKGLLEIRVVPGPGFTEQDSEKMLNNLRTLVDPGIRAVVKLMPEIPRTARRKWRWIVNEWETRTREGMAGV